MAKKEIKLNYDPYSLKIDVCEATDDRWVSCDEPWVKSIQGKLMPSWFRTSQKWKGLCAEISACAGEDIDEIIIYFEGREYGYRDLVNFCGEHNRDRSNKIWFSVVAPRTFCYEDGDALAYLADVNARVENALSHIPDDKKDLIAAAKRALRVHQICTDGEFEVAVVAPMSCGKSTIINALLRTQLLPVGNMATTAKIVRIFDVDDADRFTYTCEDAEGRPLPMSGEATQDVLRELNDNEDVFYVNIFGNVPGISAKYNQLRLVDTPGPNNSATEEHRDATYRIIRSPSHQPLVLFVQDATKLEDLSEYRLMSDVIESLRSSWLESERIIFVINRADQIDAKKENVADFVRREKERIEERFGIHAPRIIPICARASLLQSLADVSNEEDDERDHDIAVLRKKLSRPERDLVSAAEIPQEYKETIAAQKRDAIRSGNTSLITQINSGIYGLELLIDDYLKKYAIPFKVRYCGKIMYDVLEQIKQYVDESEVEAKKRHGASNVKDDPAKTDDSSMPSKAVADMKIEYDDVMLTTRIFKNVDGSWCELDADADQVRALQGRKMPKWMSPTVGWRGFLGEIGELFEQDDISVEFVGRVRDRRAFKKMCREYNTMNVVKNGKRKRYYVIDKDIKNKRGGR